MPTIRVGFSSDFVVNNNRVGLGTVSAAGGKLDVDGAIKGNFSIAGVATLTSYGGFVAQNQHINKASTIGFGTVGVGTFQQYYETETGFTDLGGVHHGDDQYYNTLSQDLVIDDGQILNITSIDMVGVTNIGEYDPHSHQSHVCLGALEELSVTDHFSVPNGGINERQSFIEGTVRFNDDLNTLEFFNGNEWKQFTYNQGQSGRAVFGGGNPMSSANQVIDFVNITTLGNAQNFGEMYALRRSGSGMSSSIRGLFGGGASPGPSSNDDTIDYITIASAGNPIDFGNLSTARRNPTGASSSTRGLTAGGYVSAANDTIDYVEIATLGNALDFGNLVQASFYPSGSSSPTRAIFAGGIGGSDLSAMSFVSFASKGNSTEFGDMVSGGGELSQGCSSSIRGIFTGGSGSSPYTKTIEYVTFSSLGNSIYFGELTQARVTFNASTQVRAVLAGGATPANVNTIDYITISSAGNAQDFGDLTRERTGACTVSDSHGGLGGF